MRRKIAKFLIFVSFVFFCTEFFLRFLNLSSLEYYRNLKKIHKFHPKYFVGLEKNKDVYIQHVNRIWEGRFTTNSLGYRGSPEPDPKSKKIFCLGDSMVMGFGVSDEDTFCYQLNGLSIQQNPKHPSSVLMNDTYQALNLGVDSFGSLGSFYRLEEATEKNHPDIVLFFVSPNDYMELAGLSLQGIRPDDELEKERDENVKYKTYFMVQFYLTKYSYLLHSLKLSLEQSKLHWNYFKLSFISELNQSGVLSFDFSKLKKYFYNSFYYEKQTFVSKKVLQVETWSCPEKIPTDVSCVEKEPDSKKLEPLPEQTQKAYDKMIHLAESKNFKLIIVLVPVQREDLFCTANKRYSPLYNYALRAKEYFKKQNTTVFDLREFVPLMCEIGDKDHSKNIMNHFLPHDGHFTVLGNKWVANSLKQKLTELGSKNAL